MRKGVLLALLAAAVGLVLGVAPAVAGDYHFGATLFCQDCHVMHGEQSHGYNDSGTAFFGPIGGTAPYDYLLRNTVTELCLGCHEGSTFAPDVLEDNTGTNVRQAGALNDGDNVAPYYDATGHTLGSLDTAPGGTFVSPHAEGLTCIDCHAQHGRSTTNVPNPYRNLSPSAGGGSSSDPPSYAVGINDPTKDIFETSANAYNADDVNFNEPDPANSAMGRFCGRCHTNFHGVVGGSEIGGDVTAGEFLRHPSAGVNIGGLGGGHSSMNYYRTGTRTGTGTIVKVNYVKVMSPTGVWPVNGVSNPTLPTDLTPSCFTCHKSHGNQNAFGLIYMEDTGTVTEEGTATGTYDALCEQCHTQGQ